MAAPRFSVLLPTHNRADVLPFAIRSVLAQSVTDFELLIVGDGCTDRTAEVVSGFADSRIRWLDLPKAAGFGYANRNVALREARGAHIAYMAHDDLWFFDHLESFVETLEGPGVEIAYSRPLWVIPKGLLAPGTFNLECPSTMNVFLAKEQNAIPTGCVVHRRSCLDKYGYWDESLARRGDLDMWARIIADGKRENFAYLHEPTCVHFRANWRKEGALFGRHELVWELFHAIDGFLPAALKIAVPGGIAEQEVIWDAMRENPAAWSKKIRAAVRQALDQRITQSDELIAKLLHQYPELEASALADTFDRVALAWKPFPGLRKLIGLNNRVRRLRSAAAEKTGRD